MHRFAAIGTGWQLDTDHPLPNGCADGFNDALAKIREQAAGS